MQNKQDKLKFFSVGYKGDSDAEKIESGLNKNFLSIFANVDQPVMPKQTNSDQEFNAEQTEHSTNSQQ